MRTHEQFLSELVISNEAVAKVAASFLSRGVPVTVRPTFQAPTFEQRGEYSDDGDLEIVLRIEVKHRGILFTGRDDYPYPTAIIDQCSNFDKKRPVPHAYYLLNQSMNTALVAHVARTQAHWTTADFPTQNGIVQPFYVCPVNILGVVRL